MTQHQMSHFARFATATALAAAALFLQASHAVAAEQVTDGWQHSLVSESLEAPATATDGWRHSLISESLEAPTPATDGWLTYVASDSAKTAAVATDGWLSSVVSDSAKTAAVATDGWQTSIGVLAARGISSPSLAATDGWLSSVVAEQARIAEQPRIAQAPASPASSGYGYMDDIAFGSALLNVILIAAGSIVLLRHRYGGTTA